MHSNRLELLTTTLLLLGSSAFAQQPTAQPPLMLPTCTPSMIVGTWHAAFGYGTPVYGTAQNNGFACPLTIAPNGTINSGACIVGSTMTVSSPPSGTLTIDRSCHVVGLITFGGLVVKPLVWPEIRLIAPGVEGPNWVVKLLSFSAKCWA